MMKSWIISKIAAVKYLAVLICVVSLVTLEISGCSSSEPGGAGPVSQEPDRETVSETQQTQTEPPAEETDKTPAQASEKKDEKPAEMVDDGDWALVYLSMDRGDWTYDGSSSAYVGDAGYPVSPDGFEVYAFNNEDVQCFYDDENGFGIKISDTGTEEWHIQLKKNGVKLENEKWYKATFDARSSIDRSVVFNMQRDGSEDEDWRTYSGSKTLELGNDWKPYTILFRMTDDTDENAIYNLALGTIGGNRITQQHVVNIKNMRLEMLEDSWLDQMRQGDNLLKNPGFEYEGTGWEASVVEPGAGKIKLENGKAVFDISNVGTLDWHVQLKQNSIPLQHGYNYRLTFKVVSTATRSIQIGFMDNEFVHWYGGDLVELGANTERTVAVEFYMNQETNKEACMFISMGKIENRDTPASVITLSDLSLVQLPGRPGTGAAWSSWSSWGGGGGGGGWTPPTFSLGGWEGSYWGGRVGQHRVESDGSYMIEVLDTGSEAWHVQLQQKGKKLEEGKWYKMSFEAKSSIDRQIECMLQKDGSSDDDWTNYSGDGKYRLSQDWRTYENTFQMGKATDNNVIYNISLGAVDGRITTPHEVYFRNIKLEETQEPPIASIPVGKEMLEGELDMWSSVAGNTLTQNNGVYTANINNVGENDYDIQIVKKGLTLEQGCTYEFQCFADFDNGERVIKVGLMQDGTYDWYGGEDLTIGTVSSARTYSGRSVELARGMAGEYAFVSGQGASSGQIMTLAGNTGKVYKIQFTVDKRTIKDGVLTISMGKIKDKDTPTGTVIIKDLSLKKISQEADQPENPGSGMIADVEGNVLKGKTPYVSNCKLDGKTITVTNMGSNPWDVQLSLGGLTLENGATYTGSCEIMSNAARTVGAGVQEDGGSYTTYGNAEDTTLQVDQWATLTFEVKRTDSTSNSAKFYINMGQFSGDTVLTEHKITIKNLSLVKKSGSEEVEPLIADIEGNVLKGIEFTPNANCTLNGITVTVNDAMSLS